MSRNLAARAAAAVALAAFGLALAPASEAQRTIDYSSRSINCEFLGVEYERIKQANADGIPREGAWITILRVVTFPMAARPISAATWPSSRPRCAA
ncbi:MAG: hypothetical protein ISN26_03315 [Betaproteobacteria bacterium AqS2]|uniref:Uncharacterized protein n=1 Tax=Candidatus Amphirhobacter heronislandensis TaxID=1732024 RepID=A0A930Y2P0_9GAMM|nr:hypothetical protein [Betaproteobacteria bacterium AqS2]